MYESGILRCGVVDGNYSKDVELVGCEGAKERNWGEGGGRRLQDWDWDWDWD